MSESTILQINARVRIPLSELKFASTRSSGPGGQNVNKNETAIELSFDIANTLHLTMDERKRAMEKLRGYIDQMGTLRLVSQNERSQQRNKEVAIYRFQKMLHTALMVFPDRRATQPSHGQKMARLDYKRKKSNTKQYRQKPRTLND